MPITSQDVEASSSAPVHEEPPQAGARDTRLRESQFLITINSNYRSTNKQDVKRVFVDFYNKLETLIKDPRIAKHFITIIPLDHSFEAHVLGVKIDTGVEYSGRSGVHAHSHWTIHHTTLVKINLQNLRQNLRTHFGPDWKPFYVEVRYVASGQVAVREYVFKTINGKKLRIPRAMDLYADGEFKFESNMGHSEQIRVAAAVPGTRRRRRGA